MNGLESVDTIRAVQSPLGLFALAVLAATSVFSLAAGFMKCKESFKYCIHMLLAIVAWFGSIALWSPASLYHPRDLVGLPVPAQQEMHPWIPTIFAIAEVVIYIAYQVYVRERTRSEQSRLTNHA